MPNIPDDSEKQRPSIPDWLMNWIMVAVAPQVVFLIWMIWYCDLRPWA